jgi:hypothetical protein
MKRFIFAMLAVALTVPAIAFAEGAPTISEVTPLAAVVNVSVTLRATASDPDGVASCNMKISSLDKGAMTYNSSSGFWEFEWTFDDSRTASSVRAHCIDSLGNAVNGPSKVLEILAIPRPLDIGTPEVSESGESEVDATGYTKEQIVLSSPVLIKTPCPGGENISHPCRTVYFLSNGGERHAFPNEKAYFTWYSDWSNIHVISAEVMASIKLGLNVRYHPGKRMVKFPSVNTVYTVSQHGVLRPIASEEVAVSLYGANWNQQIDDISEAFFGNYSYEAEVTSIHDFDPQVQRASVVSINDNVSANVITN